MNVRPLLVLLALAAPALAGTIDVPQDFPNIQAAIDAAQPHDTVVVHGGTYGPVVIEQSLTLMGEAGASITWVYPGWPYPSNSPDLVRLSGPGHGRVTIAGMTIGASADGDGIQQGGDGITGFGFSILRLVSCDVSGTDIVSGEWAGQVGGHGVAVGIPLVVVKDSHLRGGASRGCAWPGGAEDGRVGLGAIGCTVVLLGSQVEGGAVQDTTVAFPLPLVCEAIDGGVGGTGVLAGTLFVSAGSVLKGGAGATFKDATDPSSLCHKPDGAPVVADQVIALSAGAYWLGGKKP